MSGAMWLPSSIRYHLVKVGDVCRILICEIACGESVARIYSVYLPRRPCFASRFEFARIGVYMDHVLALVPLILTEISALSQKCGF